MLRGGTLFVDLFESSMAGLDSDPEEEGMDVEEIAARFAEDLLRTRQGGTMGGAASLAPRRQ